MTYRGWNVLRSCIPPESLPRSARFVAAATVFGLWGMFLIGFVYTGTHAATHWLHSRLNLLPPTFLSLSLLTWFVWGFLLLTGTLPSLAESLLTFLLLPLKVRQRFGVCLWGVPVGTERVCAYVCVCVCVCERERERVCVRMCVSKCVCMCV